MTEKVCPLLIFFSHLYGLCCQNVKQINKIRFPFGLQQFGDINNYININLSTYHVTVIVNCRMIKSHPGHYMLTCTCSAVLSAEGNCVACCLPPAINREKEWLFL